MKTSITTLLIIAATVRSLLADPATDLLDKVKAKYSTCKSFYCDGLGSTTTADHSYKSEMKFNIRFQRPSMLRVDWQEPRPSSFAPVPCSLYVENGKYYGVPSYSRKPEEFKTIEDGMGTYAGISGGTTYFIPSLLLNKKGYLYDYTCKILPDQKVNDHDCFSLEVTVKDSGQWTLAVDKTSDAIIRSTEIRTITAKQTNKSIEDYNNTELGKQHPAPPVKTKDQTFETVIDYLSPVFDKDMTPDEFVFKATTK